MQHRLVPDRWFQIIFTAESQTRWIWSDIYSCLPGLYILLMEWVVGAQCPQYTDEAQLYLSYLWRF